MNPKRFFFVLVAVTALLAVGGGAGYYFASQGLTDRRELLRKRLADIEVADHQITQLNGLKSQYLAVEPFLPRIDQALPRSKQQAQIVLQLERLARDAGMSLPGATFTSTSGLAGPTTQSTKVGDVYAMPITLQLSGSYEQMQAFLRQVEKLGRYASVTNVTITNAGPKKVNFNATISVFLKP